MSLEDFQARMIDPRYRIAFSNPGGVTGKGVCWWHSRWQRSAWFLADFQPWLPRPTTLEALEIMRKLAQANDVVAIPGYSDLESFTRDYRGTLTRYLSVWQVSDAVWIEWLKGLEGSYESESHALTRRMNLVFQQWMGGGKYPVFIIEQVPGIAAHAGLVIRMEPTNAGYSLWIVDSSKPESVREVHYRIGDRSLSYADGKSPWVPYVDQVPEMNRIIAAYRAHCGRLPTDPR